MGLDCDCMLIADGVPWGFTRNKHTEFWKEILFCGYLFVCRQRFGFTCAKRQRKDDIDHQKRMMVWFDQTRVFERERERERWSVTQGHYSGKAHSLEAKQINTQHISSSTFPWKHILFAYSCFFLCLFGDTQKVSPGKKMMQGFMHYNCVQSLGALPTHIIEHHNYLCLSVYDDATCDHGKKSQSITHSLEFWTSIMTWTEPTNLSSYTWVSLSLSLLSQPLDWKNCLPMSVSHIQVSYP